MKTFNKKDLEERFKSCKYKSIIKNETLKNPLKIKSLSLEKKYTMIIPGKPIADSRPRYTSVSGHFYNPHLANMIKVMDQIHIENDPNQDVCIMSPMYVEIRAYMKIPSTHLKLLTKEQRKALSKDELYSFMIKDNDNLEKVGWDALQKYNIILKDEFIVKNDTEKFYVDSDEKQRVEIYIYYTEKDRYAKEIIQGMKEHMYYTLTMKYKFLNGIADNNWRKIFYSNIVKFYKRNPKLKKDMKKLGKILDAYKIEDLKLIENGSNRNNIIDKIIRNVNHLLNEMNKKNK